MINRLSIEEIDLWRKCRVIIAYRSLDPRHGLWRDKSIYQILHFILKSPEDAYDPNGNYEGEVSTRARSLIARERRHV